jgi:hypothetical protein
VAVRTAQHWVEEYRASGEVTPRKMGNPSPPKLAAHRELVLEVLGAEPDIAIEGLRHTLAERGIVIGYGSIRRFFAREGIRLVPLQRLRRRRRVDPLSPGFVVCPLMREIRAFRYFWPSGNARLRRASPVVEQPSDSI